MKAEELDKIDSNEFLDKLRKEGDGQNIQVDLNSNEDKDKAEKAKLEKEELEKKQKEELEVKNKNKTPEELETEQKVIKDKEDKDKEKKEKEAKGENTEEEGIIQTIQKAFEYTPEENKEYAESNEGLVELVNDISDSKAINSFNELVNSTPGLKEYYEFIKSGGKQEDFIKVNYPDIEYNKIDITTEEGQNTILREKLQKEGLTKEEINSKLDRYKKSGIKADEAKDAQTLLSNIQEKEKKELIENQKLQQQKAIEDNNKYWTNIKDTITKSNTIKGLEIPLKEKEELFKYMAIPIDNKTPISQEYKDIQEEDLETRIAIAYLRMKKLDIAKLVQNTAKTIIAQEKRLKFKQEENKQKPSNKQTELKGVFGENLHEQLLAEEAKNGQN